MIIRKNMSDWTQRKNTTVNDIMTGSHRIYFKSGKRALLNYRSFSRSIGIEMWTTEKAVKSIEYYL